MLRRIGFGFLSLVVALLPMVALWLVMLAMMMATNEEPTSSAVKTPSPSKSSVLFFGPLDMLVYANPFFAATIQVWLAPWLLILAGYAIFAAAIVRDCSPSDAPRFRRAGVLTVIALLLGMGFATPWFYGVYCLAVYH